MDTVGSIGKFTEAVGKTAGGYHWGNPKFRQLASMGAAEIICDAVSIGALMYLGCGHGPPGTGPIQAEAKQQANGKGANGHFLVKCDKDRDPLKDLKTNLANTIIKPLMPVIKSCDWFLSNLWPEGFRQRQKMNDAACSHEYADGFVNFGGAFGAGVLAKLLTRNALNKAFGAPMSTGHAHKVFWSDEGAHLLATAAIGTVLSKPTGKVTGALSKVLRNVGFSDEQADNSALYLTTMVAPNLAGFGVAWYLIMRGEKPGLIRSK